MLGCNVTTVTGDTVKQVRWLNKHDKVLLAYEPVVPARISEQLVGVELVAFNNNTSYINITRVRPDDDGCFRCFFDIYPTGSQEGHTCIKVISESAGTYTFLLVSITTAKFCKCGYLEKSHCLCAAQRGSQRFPQCLEKGSTVLCGLQCQPTHPSTSCCYH